METGTPRDNLRKWSGPSGKCSPWKIIYRGGRPKASKSSINTGIYKSILQEININSGADSKHASLKLISELDILRCLVSINSYI